MTVAERSGPLAHVLAVDISRELAGSYAATLLETVGARILRFDPQAPDGRTRDARELFHGGERRAVRPPDDDGLLTRAFAAADVLVHDRGVAAVLPGWDDERLRAVNPRLIRASFPNFPSGSALAGIPADETVVAAYAGIYGDQGGRGAAPVFLSLPICSYAAAVLGCCGITAALLARGPEDGGQDVEVSLFSAALAMQAGQAVAGPKIAPMSGGKRLPQGTNPLFRLYRASDGQWFLLACGNNVFFNKLCVAVDRLDLLEDPRWNDAPWGIAPEHFEEMTGILARHFAAKPVSHWLSVLDAGDLPVAPVLTRSQFLDHPQVVHSRIALAGDDPHTGAWRRMGAPIDFSGSPAASSAPVSDPEAVLADLGNRNAAVHPPSAGAKPKRRAAPLDGLTVVSFAMYIAGSAAASLLADLGARVVKIEPPHGDPFRTIGGGFQAWNRGVRSIGLDLSNGASRGIVDRLVGQADVVIENFRVGMAKKLAVDYETLSKVKPDLVYCSLTGYGDDGPYAERPAFDPLFQAQSGLMQAEGGQDRPPIMLRMSVSDHMAGMLAAWGVVTALLHRRRTGLGQRVSTNLLNAIIAAQAAEFFGNAVDQDWLPQIGMSPLRRIFEASDGWLFVSAEDQWPALCRALDAPGLAEDPRFAGPRSRCAQQELSDLLESRFRREGVVHWLGTLRAEGVKCARADSIAADLMSNAEAIEAGVVAVHQSSELGEVRQPGLSIRFSETPGKLWGAAPSLGQDTDETLGGLGFGTGEIAELRREKVVV